MKMSMKIDMHIHTKYSWDSNNEIRDIIKVAKKIGLDGVAIADHNTAKASLKYKKTFEKNDLLLIPAMEIRTEVGEVLAYFINEEIKSRNLHEVIDEIRDQGAKLCIPHPFDSFRGSSINNEEIIDNIKPDFIEGFNSRCFLNIFNKKAIKYAKLRGIPVTAGSDAHLLSEIGNAYVIVDCIEDLLKGRNIKVFGKKTKLKNFFLIKINKIKNKIKDFT